MLTGGPVPMCPGTKHSYIKVFVYHHLGNRWAGWSAMYESISSTIALLNIMYLFFIFISLRCWPLLHSVTSTFAGPDIS